MMDMWNIKCLAVAFLLMCLRSTLGMNEDDDESKPPWGRCPWIRDKLRNGRVKIRSRGRIAKFYCNSGYEMVGKRFATCVRGQWNHPVPVCVSRGCYRLPEPANGRVTEMYLGALLVYDCLPGYSRHGPSSLYCDGARWSEAAPICEASMEQPQLSCDFEEPDLCGWAQDTSHDFDWKRNQYNTPTGPVGTGPAYDHTFGIGKGGFYLYMETSYPRKENDTARIYSPVFPSHYLPGCFIFWYHMYGPSTGGLRVYIKPESHEFSELLPSWEKFGDQGDNWLRGEVALEDLSENFQVIIEGIRGTSYSGDTAIDDVSIHQFDCYSPNINNSTGISEVTAYSCRGRCREEESSEQYVCSCSGNCLNRTTCCRDFWKICGDPSVWEERTDVQESSTESYHDTYSSTDTEINISSLPPITSELNTTAELPQERTSTDNPTDSSGIITTELPTTSTKLTPATTTNTDFTTTSQSEKPDQSSSTFTSFTKGTSTSTGHGELLTTYVISSMTPITTKTSSSQIFSYTISQGTPEYTEEFPLTTLRRVESHESDISREVLVISTEPSFTAPATVPQETGVSSQEYSSQNSVYIQQPTTYSAYITPEQSSAGTSVAYEPTTTEERHTSPRNTAKAHESSTVALTTSMGSRLTTKGSTTTKRPTYPTTVFVSSSPSTPELTNTAWLYTSSIARTSVPDTTLRPTSITTRRSVVTLNPMTNSPTKEPIISLPFTETGSDEIVTETLSDREQSAKPTASTEKTRKTSKSQSGVDHKGSETPPSKSASALTGSSISVTGVSIGICLVVGLIAVAVYFGYRRRSRKQNKLDEDSEIRFLSENEVVEFSNGSEKPFQQY